MSNGLCSGPGIPKRPPGPNFFVFSFWAGIRDGFMDYTLTLHGQWEDLHAAMDGDPLPPFTKIYQGDAARTYLKRLAREQKRLLAAQRLRDRAGGTN